jgi:hypothetical protein
MKIQTPTWLGIDLFLWMLASVLAFEFFLIQSHVGLNLSDEGFFWYGAQAVFHGEVPIRDFEAYNPGRYYWGALWFHGWRPGLIPLRFSETVFKALGLFLGLLAAKRLTANRWELAGIGLVLALWVFPDYRVFDCVIPMASVYVGCKLLEKPEPVVLWISGVYVSLVLFMGLNHGVYAFISFLTLLFIVYLRERKGALRKLGFAAIGLLTGLLPFWILFIGADGFFQSFVHDIQRHLRLGLSIPVPIPWPWAIVRTGSFFLDTSSTILGILFLAVPLFYMGWGFSIFRRFKVQKPGTNLLLACVVVGISYLQYAFSRADDQHLAVALSPFFLGILAQASPKPLWRRSLLILALMLSTACAGIRSGLIQEVFPVPGFVECQLGGDKINLDPSTAAIIEMMRETSKKIRPGESLLVYPHLPAIYPILGLQSPIWGLYACFPDSEAEQIQSIRAIEQKNVRWALIDNWGIDGRQDLTFEKDQPLLWDYLKNHFQIFSMNPQLNVFVFYRPDGFENNTNQKIQTAK